MIGTRFTADPAARLHGAPGFKKGDSSWSKNAARFENTRNADVRFDVAAFPSRKRLVEVSTWRLPARIPSTLTVRHNGVIIGRRRRRHTQGLRGDRFVVYYGPREK